MDNEKCLNEEIRLPNLSQLSFDNRDIKKMFEDFDKLSSTGFVNLAGYGWYPSYNITTYEMLDLMLYAKNDEQSKIDIFLCKYYSKKIKLIVKDIIKHYPERKVILEEALKAHKLKLYHSSVALFLSQADGICNGILFMAKNNKKAIKEFLSINKIPIDSFKSITSENAIDIYHKKVVEYPSTLNRHSVFHGYDFNYGNETNSLKALSLLSFITYILKESTK